MPIGIDIAADAGENRIQAALDDQSAKGFASGLRIGWKMSPRERAMLIGVVLLTSLTFACGLTMADPDLWGHTLYGLRAIDKGVLVERVDPFSYTATNASWVNHEWLTEYQFGWLWKLWGSTGLWLWRNVMVAAVFAVAAYCMWRSDATVAAAVALFAFGAETLADFVVFVRPQLATYALFALTLTILRRWWDDPDARSIWLLPLLSGVWVNLHGGFLAGLGILLLFLAAGAVRASSEDRFRSALRSLAAVVGLSFLATLANPYGPRIYEMLWHHLATEQFVREWQPLWASRQSLTYYAPFLLIGLSLISLEKWKWIDALVLMAVGYQACAHIRHVALLAIAALVLLPGPLSASLGRLFRGISQQWSGNARRWLRVAAVFVVAAALVALQVRVTAKFWKDGIRPWDIAVEVSSDVPGMPLRAISLIKREGIGGNLVTDYGWAQFVLWQLHPQVRIAFDGRYRTVYPARLEEEFMDFQRASRRRPLRTPILDDYPTEIALLPTERGPCQYLDARDDWVLVFADDQASLYVADIPKFHELIERVRSNRLSPPSEPVAWQTFPAGVAAYKPSPQKLMPAMGDRSAAVSRPNAGRVVGQSGGALRTSRPLHVLAAVARVGAVEVQPAVDRRFAERPDDFFCARHEKCKCRNNTHCRAFSNY